MSLPRRGTGAEGNGLSSVSRALLLVAVLALILLTVWALRTPPHPNSDRYDYLGRAARIVAGDGPRALVEYPLRFAFAGAETLPAVDIVRPPLWPLLTAALLFVGENAGVVLGALCLLLATLVTARSAERRFGAPAGGVAALALTTSYAAVHGFWNGGPEPALALGVALLWSPSEPSGRGRLWLQQGLPRALLPWLHPTGWMYLLLAGLPRALRRRSIGATLFLLAVLLLASPWYVRNAFELKVPGGSLQAQAELAKAIDAREFLGPYRTLQPEPTASVLAERSGDVLRTLLRRTRDRLLRADGWLAWPLLLLAAGGVAAQRRRVAVDLVRMAVALGVLLAFSSESRFLLPLLPVGAGWVGAGAAAIPPRRHPTWLVAAVVVLCALLPWFLPLGRAMRPGAELLASDAHVLSPAEADVLFVRGLDAPYFTDSGVLAWRAGRPAVLLPEDPLTLEMLRARPPLRESDTLVLARGTASAWLRGEEWERFLSGAERRYEGGGGLVVLRIPRP